MEITTYEVRVAGGEFVMVDAYGMRDGKPVLVHPGSPGSRRLFGPDAELAAREYGLRLISFDRPGYGGRPARPGRTLADGVEETRRVAEALGLQRFGVLGISGGGPYALGCAARLPEQVTGAVVMASFAPYGAPGLDFCGDWPEEYRAEVDRFFTDQPTARKHWRQDAERFHAACSEPEGWMARWGDVGGTDDAHSHEVAAHLAAGVRDSLSGGDEGYWDDWVVYLSSWGVDLRTLSVPVRLWHGASDRNVPVSNGHWLAANVPHIEATFREDEDHSNVEENNKRAAYAWLSDRG